MNEQYNGQLSTYMNNMIQQGYIKLQPKYVIRKDRIREKRTEKKGK